MSKKNKYAILFLLICVMSFPLISMGASNTDGVYFPTSGETGLSDVGIKDILVNILTWMLEVVGVVALIGFVISGTIYITSSGDSKQAERAKAAMTNSIIGIVVVLASFVVIKAIDIMLKGSSSKF